MNRADERAPFCRIRAVENGWSVERYHAGGGVELLLPFCHTWPAALTVAERLDADLAEHLGEEPPTKRGPPSAAQLAAGGALAAAASYDELPTSPVSDDQLPLSLDGDHDHPAVHPRRPWPGSWLPWRRS